VARKSKDIPHLRLRIEPSLLARLEKSAEKNERTLTGEIVERLNTSFKRDDLETVMKASAKEIAERLLMVMNASGLVNLPSPGGGEHTLASNREFLASLPKAPPGVFSQADFAEKMFELDLDVMAELDPDTPRDEHARRLRELNARRIARLKP
jgi:hypothetical protein